MHGAPSVVYPVGRSAFLGLLLLGVWAAGALACTAWVLATASGWRAALAIGACLAIGGAAVRSWRSHGTAVLAWDGAQWTWSAPRCAASPPGRVHVTVDLQRALLVRWHAPGQARWFWLERGRAPQHWDALRRAVYSPAVPDATTGAEPPAA